VEEHIAVATQQNKMKMSLGV